MHDVSRAEEGVIRFWPSESLVTKVHSSVSAAADAGLPAEVAPKLYGVANLSGTGIHARGGRERPWAINDRQEKTAVDITPLISTQLLLYHPSESMSQKEYPHWNRPVRQVITTSDAAYEVGTGFVRVANPGQPGESKLGRVIAIPGCLYSIGGVRAVYTAQLELLAARIAIIEVAGATLGTNSICFIDHVAGLMEPVESSSGSRSLDQLAKIIHVAHGAVR